MLFPDADALGLQFQRSGARNLTTYCVNRALRCSDSTSDFSVRGADVPQALSVTLHFIVSEYYLHDTARHAEAFQVPPPYTHIHIHSVFSYLRHTAGTSLAAKSASPAVLCRVLRDLSAHYARLPVTNTHYCCPSQQEKKESRERYLKWSRKTNEPYFSSALLCLVCRQSDTYGSEILGPLFLLLCIASALIGGRSSCAHSHLVSAAAAASSSISTPPREDSSLAPP